MKANRRQMDAYDLIARYQAASSYRNSQVASEPRADDGDRTRDPQLGKRIRAKDGNLGPHGNDVLDRDRSRISPTFPVPRYHRVTTEAGLERFPHSLGLGL